MFVRVDRIRQLLKTKGISANKMLTELNQSPNNLTRWERGGTEPSRSHLAAIANYLGVDINYLAGLSDSPYSDNLIEDMSDKLIEAGVEIWSEDEDFGAGQEYELKYEGKTYNYQEHDFSNICSRLKMELNDAELNTVDRFCKELFLGEVFPGPNESTSYNKDEQDLIEKYRQLDDDGKIMLKSALIAELRRIS